MSLACVHALLNDEGGDRWRNEKLIGGKALSARVQGGSGNPPLLDGPWGEPFSPASSDPIRPCCLPRLFDYAFQQGKGSTIASYSSGETGGRVLCDPLVHRRPTGFPFSSPLSSRNRGDVRPRTSPRNSVKNCDCYFRCNFYQFVLPWFELDGDHFPVYWIVEFQIDSLVRIRMQIERGSSIEREEDFFSNRERVLFLFFLHYIAAQLPSNFGRL